MNDPITAAEAARITTYLNIEAPPLGPSAHVVFGTNQPGTAELVARRNHEIRHLLTRTVWTAVNHIEHVLSWSAQRLEHQTRAMISHYWRRGDPLPRHPLRT